MSVIRIPADPDFRPFPEQAAFINDRHRWVIASCANRSGKTHGGAVHLLRRLFELKQQGIINRETGIGADRRCEIEAIVVAPIFSMLEPARKAIFDCLSQDAIESWNKSEQNLILRGSVKIMFRSGEDGGQRLRGLKAHAFWWDEVSAPPGEPALFEEVLRARVSDWAPHSFGLFTTTPDSGSHWFAKYIRMAQRGEDGWSLHSWPALAAPFVSRAEVEAVRAQLPDRVFRRFWISDSWSSPTEARVFDEFNPDADADKPAAMRHLITESEAKMLYGCGGQRLREAALDAMIGHDPGFSSAGSAVTLLDFGDHLLAVDEHYESRLLPFGDPQRADNWGNVIRDMKQRWDASRVVVDSEMSSMTEYLTRGGTFATPAEKGPGSVVPGMLRIAAWLHPGPRGPRLRLLKGKLPNLERELQQVQWKFIKQLGIYDEHLDNTPRHSVDALSYVLRVMTAYKNTWQPKRESRPASIRGYGPIS